MYTLIDDIQSAWRQIRTAPRFSVFIIALIAIGTGFNLAVFSLLDALLLKPLPVRKPNELVRFVQILPNIDARSNYPFRFYELMRQNTKMFSNVICDSNLSTAVRDETGVASRVRCQVVSGNFFTALGVSALHGRVLTLADEVQVSDALPVVLSYPYWQSRFQGDPAIVGKRIRLQEFPFTVVGILPREFNGVQVETGPDVRAPLIAADLLEMMPQIKSFRRLSYEIVARLRPGAGLHQAEAEAQSIYGAALDEANQAQRQNGRLEARPIPRGHSVLREKYSGVLVLLMAGVALVLLMICTNVGGILLARASARSQDTAIRMALGATAGRVVRQWLTATLLLAIAGVAAGLCIVWVLLPLLVRGLPPVRDFDHTLVALSLNLKPDGRFLAFSLGLCLASAVLAGLPPAFQAARADIYVRLRGGRSTPHQKIRWVLVGLQTALCTLLLGATTLLITTFRNLQATDPGFCRDNIVTFSADPGMLPYTGPQLQSLKSRLLAAVRGMTDVESAALSSVGLMRGAGLKTTVAPAGQRAEPGDFLNTSVHLVTPEYFETMGIRLLQGRNLRPDEPAAKPMPTVVNSAFARRFFPGADPIGKKFGMGANVVVQGDYVVIGVVSDAKYRSLREPFPPTFYGPWSAEGRRMGLILHVRTRGRPEALIEPVRRALYAIDPRLPFYDVRTLAEEVRASMWTERALAWLSSLFSMAAVMLAVMAVYGTVAYAITEGNREIGIRTALGARTADVLAMTSKRPLAAIGMGIAAGVPVFYAAIPLARDIFYGIRPTDTFNVVLTVAAVLLAGLAAALSASRKALRIDPAEVLRLE
jgi:predicted permease